MSVHNVFSKFCSNLTIDNRETISLRYKEITKRLNRDYYASDSEVAHSLYVGSYGRNTAIRGFSDLDMLFVLPFEVYQQYQGYSGNKQSSLLQAIRTSLQGRYSNSKIGADGQVVEINFDDGLTFQVVPCFLNKDSSYTYPDSNVGGSWKITNPKPEIEAVDSWDNYWKGNLKWLARMTRAWKETWAVPIAGLLIDTLAYTFLLTWKYSKESFTYYDWMSRDFMKFLMELDESQQYWQAIGSKQYVYKTGAFSYKAKRCFNICQEALDAQSNNYEYLARAKWREIYGSRF